MVTTRMLAMAVALGVSGCADGDSPPTPDARGHYLDVHLDEGIEICAGEVAAYDDFLRGAFGLWGEQVPEDFRVSVYAKRDSGCSIGTSCAPEGEVRLGTQASAYHELGHAVHQALDGRSVTSLEEGVATALGPLQPFVLQRSTLADASVDFLFATDRMDADSGLGAVLTRYLIEQYGVDSFRGFFRALGGAAPPSATEIEQQFEIAFGEPLDDVWGVVTSEDRCGYDLWYCEPWAPQALPVEIDGIDCDAPTTRGFEALDYVRPSAPYRPQALVHVEVDEPRTLVVTGGDIAHAVFQFARCGECMPPPAPTPVYEDLADCQEQVCNPVAFEYAVEPGRYVFIFEQFPNEPAVRVSITDGPPPPPG
jgi:hypothetical protein